MSSLSEMIATWRRILKLMHKPDRQEYKSIIKFTLISLLILGGMGFIIRLLCINMFAKVYGGVL